MSDPTAPDPIREALRKAAAAMLDPIDHRSHKHSSWPSSECDDCMSIRKVRADRLRAALSDSTPSAPTLDVERLARALHDDAESIESDPTDWHDCEDKDEHREFAASLAAEYARLHETPQPEPRSPSRRAPK